MDAYKFRSSREASGHIAELLHGSMPLLPPDVVVTWVPTAPAHIRYRGMDHTRLIATAYAGLCGQIHQQMLARMSGDMQHFKSRQDRLRDVKKTISYLDNVPEKVLIIDDILTTGATMMACAKKLREAGAAEVYVAIVARQPGWNSQ